MLPTNSSRHSIYASLFLIHMQARPLYHILSQIKSITTASQGPLELSCTSPTSVKKDWLYVSGNVQDANFVVQLFDASPNLSWLLHSQSNSSTPTEWN